MGKPCDGRARARQAHRYPEALRPRSGAKWPHASPQDRYGRPTGGYTHEAAQSAFVRAVPVQAAWTGPAPDRGVELRTSASEGGGTTPDGSRDEVTSALRRGVWTRVGWKARVDVTLKIRSPSQWSVTVRDTDGGSRLNQDDFLI